ncbi:MAG: trypsin-like serine peptidase [Chthoniobacterales bacterium]
MAGRVFWVGVLIALGISGFSYAQVIPQRVSGATAGQLPYSATGLIDTRVGNAFYRGSGAVARDPRLVFTCAHVAFDRGTWASSIGIAVGWNARFDAPSYTQMRGWRYFSGYAASALVDASSAQTFNLDFLVGYRNEPIGPVVQARAAGAGYLTNPSVQKMVLGYPSARDFDGVDGAFFMHRTGPFSGGFSQEFDAYHGFTGASTGEGNSGGPVFEASSGDWILAAILVSGSRNSIGVYAIDSSAWQLSSNALEALGSAPSPNPEPGPDSGGGPISPAAEMDELIAIRSSLVDRLTQARRIKNPQARSIQLRRLRSMLLDLNFQIAFLRQ